MFFEGISVTMFDLQNMVVQNASWHYWKRITIAPTLKDVAKENAKTYLTC
jgi:hypothetical protein